MTTSQEPALDTDTEVTPGDVIEDPTRSDEDGTNPHLDGGDESPDTGNVPQGPQETNAAADDPEIDESFDSTSDSD